MKKFRNIVQDHQTILINSEHRDIYAIEPI